MNDTGKSNEGGNNIEKIQFEDLSPSIQAILEETGGDIFRLLEQYVVLENRVSDEVLKLRKENELLRDELAEARRSTMHSVGEVMSAETLQDRVNELEKNNKFLNKRVVEAEKNATVDVLTGIKNHRYFLEEFPKLINWVHRGQIDNKEKNTINNPGQISMIFFDLDHFKEVNDTYGHEVGDTVLRSIGALLKEGDLFRNTDCVARYGGEEFVVILPNCGLENAKLKAEEIRMAIEKLPFDFRDEPVTASVGVTSVDLPMDKKLTEVSVEKLQKGLKKVSDELLYSAKNAGRNNVQFKQIELGSIVPEFASKEENTAPVSAAENIDGMTKGA
ncbi:GGDEF domain-containing protein [Patescibacteria group bacterium]|nr:GGDEF domain-containing protein [Patescibacteria group bacterium]